MQFYAKDIMTTELLTASPEMTCKQLEEMFITEKVSGAPVVNDFGELIGVISVYDVMESEYHHNFYSDSYQEINYGNDNTPLELQYEDLVSDYMQRVIYTAVPDTPVSEVAATMYKNKIHRVIILEPDTDKPVGIISTFDLLKLQAEAPTVKI